MLRTLLSFLGLRSRKQVLYVPMWSCAGKTLVRLEVYR